MSSKNFYLIEAIYNWCYENNLTPYIAANVTNNPSIPKILKLKSDALVFDISDNSARNLTITKDCLSFTTKLEGDICDVEFPINKIISIFAKENGDGITFSSTEEELEQENSPITKSQRNFKIVK